MKQKPEMTRFIPPLADKRSIFTFILTDDVIVLEKKNSLCSVVKVFVFSIEVLPLVG